MSAADALGLVLAWTRTCGSQMVLQLIFGMGGTRVSIYIHFVRRLVIMALKSDPAAAICLPSLEKIRKYCIKVLLLKNILPYWVFGVLWMD